jgi:hypothetical protein
VPALKIHTTAPVDPHSAMRLNSIGAETTVDPWSRHERRDSALLRPPCYRDPSGAGPDAGPGDRHVTAPAAAQRPEGPRAPPSESATWRAETGTVRLQTRRASPGPGPLRPEPATSARPEETGPGPRDPGRGAARAAGPAGPGSEAAGRAPGSPGGGRSQSRDGPARWPAREVQKVPAHAGQGREQRRWVG